MKKLIYLTLLIFLISCSIENEKKKQNSEKAINSYLSEIEENYGSPKKVFISGKVLNFNPYKTEISIYPNRLGYFQEQLNAELDSAGYFSISFDSYIPCDIFFKYETGFLILAHPGDSIYLKFDGSLNKRVKLLESIIFSGDASKTNQDAAYFQKLYFSDSFMKNLKARYNAYEKYNIADFKKYLDTLQQKSTILINKFEEDKSLHKETIIWASTLAEQDYYDAISFYPHFHKMMNKLKTDEWNVPDDYYEPMLKRLPITESMFISAYALSGFINTFNAGYVYQKLVRHTTHSKTSPLLRDSLTVNGIISLTPDTLLKQMLLTEFFSQNLETSEIEMFERYQNIIEEQISLSLLKEPLLNQYYQTKYQLENSKTALDATLSKLEHSSFNQILDSIKLINKGKIIYVDCWATWCSPCRDEMKHSKELMKKVLEEDVAFVFLCMDSDEQIWKASLDKLQIGGQHYFLNKEQSTTLRKTLKIQGIPYYFLIDKYGDIAEKGNHLTPLSVMEKIDFLLEK